MVFSFKHCVYNRARENKKDKMASSKTSAKSRNSGRSSGTRSTSSLKSFTRERAIKEKLKMAELMAETSFIEKKHTSRYQAEKLEPEKNVAKSKAKVKVLEERKQPTTALRTSFAPRKTAPCGKAMQADSYWNVSLLDEPRQRCPDRREHERHLTRNFTMRDPDFTRIDQMNNPNWQEANETQSYKLGDVRGRYSEENDYNTEMICKLLQQRASPHVDIGKFDGNPINYQYFMNIFKEVVEDRIEDPTGRLIRLIKHRDGEGRELS